MSQCKQCGKCCNKGDKWYLSKNPIIKLINEAEILPRKESGKCEMLQENGLCGIEANLGRDAKPDVCKEFNCEKSVKE